MSKGQRKTRGARAHRDRFEYNEDTELILAIRAGAATAEQASEELLAVHGVERSAASIEVYTRRFPEKYQEYRDKLAERLEAKVAADGRANIDISQEIIGLCAEQARRDIAAGWVKDPSKVAEHWANVASKQKDTMLAVEGRPNKVVEHRGLPEIYARLEAMGVVEVTDAEVVETPQLETAKD